MATRKTPPLSRRYGFFFCEDCQHGWESSHVYCVRGTKKVYYRQGCRLCDTKIFPYDTERLRCSACGLQDCRCTEEEREARARHVDRKKPHLAELCDKCQAGYPCQRGDDYYDDYYDDDDDSDCNCNDYSEEDYDHEDECDHYDNDYDSYDDDDYCWY